jgi:hypothetical protein
MAGKAGKAGKRGQQVGVRSECVATCTSHSHDKYLGGVRTAYSEAFAK